MKPMRVYSHADDLDGLLSGLALWALGHEQPVWLTYGQEDQIGAGPCIIADLNLADDHPALANPETVVVDHHADRRGRVRARVVYEPGLCSAKLVCRAMRRLAAEGREVSCIERAAFNNCADWAQASDYMLADSPCFGPSRALSALVAAAGAEAVARVLRPAWPWLVADPRMASLVELGAAMRLRDRTRGEAAARDSLWTASVPGIGTVHVGVLPRGSASEVGGALAEELGAPVALVALQTAHAAGGAVAVEVRGPGAGAVAELMGGRGHPHAAAFRLPWRGLTLSLSAAVAGLLGGHAPAGGRSAAGPTGTPEED
jgi:hypothetical protein